MSSGEKFNNHPDNNFDKSSILNKRLNAFLQRNARVLMDKPELFAYSDEKVTDPHMQIALCPTGLHEAVNMGYLILYPEMAQDVEFSLTQLTIPSERKELKKILDKTITTSADAFLHLQLYPFVVGNDLRSKNDYAPLHRRTIGDLKKEDNYKGELRFSTTSGFEIYIHSNSPMGFFNGDFVDFYTSDDNSMPFLKLELIDMGVDTLG